VPGDEPFALPSNCVALRKGDQPIPEPGASAEVVEVAAQAWAQQRSAYLWPGEGAGLVWGGRPPLPAGVTFLVLKGDPMRTPSTIACLCLGTALSGGVAVTQQREIPKTIAESVGRPLSLAQWQITSVAEAMPEGKYDFVPTTGEFKGVRTFAEQIKHVACSHVAFFNEIEGKVPPEHCEKGGPSPAKTKAELLGYLKESFEYGNRVLASTDEKNALARVEGPYGGPNTRLGIAILAVWHISGHYGQLVEYLRMNGIVPPMTQQYPLAVR
jgi:uncharacterized damage-inducible protein DinB